MNAPVPTELDLPPTLLDRETSAFTLTGPSVGKLLQGLLTQDVERLSIGALSESFVLAPRGQVVALVRVGRMAEQWMLATETCCADALMQHLKPHLALSRTAVNCIGTPWRITAASHAAETLSSEAAQALTAGRDGCLLHAGGTVVMCDRALGVPSLAVFAPPPQDGCITPRAAVDALRIVRGEPRFGLDIFADTLPAETGLEARTVSYTKGCYCGQEVVAKQHWLGQPRRRLVHFSWPVHLAPEAALFLGQHEVRLTSRAESHGLVRALGLVPSHALTLLPENACVVGAV
jgi:folate-binding protein YgfZ